MSTRCAHCGSMFINIDMCKSCKRPVKVTQAYSTSQNYLDHNDEVGRIDLDDFAIVKELTDGS